MIENSTEIHFENLKEELIKENRFDPFIDLILELQTHSNILLTDEDYLQKVFHSFKKVINLNNFYVALYNSKSKKYKFPIFIDEVDFQLPVIDLDLSRSLTDFVRRRGKAILLEKTDDIRLIKSNEVDLVGELAESWMGIPLVSVNKIIGVLVIQSYSHKVLYNELDLKIVSFLSNSIAQFLEKNDYISNLQEDRKHFNIAQDVSRFGSFEVDVYNDFWWISPKVFSIINSDKVECGNFRPLREAILKCTTNNFDKLFFEFITNTKKLDIELEWVSAESSKIRVVRIIAKKFIENNGRTLIINGIVKDITEQRSYEIQLKKAKEKAEESDN